MKIPVNNTPELAQWYLEKGREKSSGGWVGNLLMLLVTPIFPPMPLVLLFEAIFVWPKGRKMRQIGEAMNEAAGRENYMRPRGFRSTRFMPGREAKGPNGRYGRVEDHPPVEPVWA